MNFSVFDRFPEFSTERITLQQFELSDADAHHQLLTDPEVMMYMDGPMPKDKEEVHGKIEQIIKDFEEQKGIIWTIKLKNQSDMLGYFGFWRIDRKNHRVEMGYALKKEYWKQGIATEAARLAIDFAFNEFNVHSICANINPSNAPSRALLMKLGFRQEAYFREDYYFNGKFMDSAIFSLLVSDWK